MKKWKSVLSWVLRILVSLGFLLASLGKLSSLPEVINMFENWGYPKPFYFIVGILEILFAILIIIPKTIKMALIGLGVLMIGAVMTHLINDPVGELIRPFIFIFLLTGVYYLNYYKVKSV